MRTLLFFALALSLNVATDAAEVTATAEAERTVIGRQDYLNVEVQLTNRGESARRLADLGYHGMQHTGGWHWHLQDAAGRQYTPARPRVVTRVAYIPNPQLLRAGATHTVHLQLLQPGLRLRAPQEAKENEKAKKAAKDDAKGKPKLRLGGALAQPGNIVKMQDLPAGAYTVHLSLVLTEVDPQRHRLPAQNPDVPFHTGKIAFEPIAFTLRDQPHVLDAERKAQADLVTQGRVYRQKKAGDDHLVLTYRVKRVLAGDRAHEGKDLQLRVPETVYHTARRQPLHYLKKTDEGYTFLLTPER